MSDNFDFNELLSDIPEDNRTKFLGDLLTLFKLSKEDNYDDVIISVLSVR